MTSEQGNHLQTSGKASGRRNKRVNLRFPVGLEVPSDDGGTLSITAQTVVVSHAGATLEMDVAIPTGTGLQVSPPFGGTLLAEVNGAWVDKDSGRRRVSIRLIDPPSWTSPERFSVPVGEPNERVSLLARPGVARMLAEYAAYSGEMTGEEKSIEEVAGEVLERALLSDERFQEWFSEKILEDLQAWEEAFVRKD
ncbi:MAG TPA: hypothetical protein VLJ61_00150 [Pyrinomonadaceae bacterium]|nr:hypothetical protein [Pyrinomonadaceae bacterium]